MDRCRLCGQSKTIAILSSLETVFHEEYSLKQCPKCSFVSLSPLPDDRILEKYYQENYWQKETSKALNLLFSLRMTGIIRELKRLVPAKGRILDWGAGDGSLITLLDKHGFSSYGIDRYKTSRKNKKICNATIHNAPFPLQYFDAIVCLHVLEHLSDPADSVRSALNFLKPGGIFVVEAPNISSFQYRLFKKRWQPLEIPTHLNHFNPATLSKIFTDSGKIEIIKTSFFSSRVSPGAFVLSIFPFFTPKLIRKKYKGRYPIALKIFYLLLQLAVCPVVLAEAYCKRGGIIRIYLRKKG